MLDRRRDEAYRRSLAEELRVVLGGDSLHSLVVRFELVDPAHRITVRMPIGDYRSPGFLIGPEHDVILWGFTGGIIARLFDFLGWSTEWDESQVRDLPSYMLQGDPRRGDVRAHIDFEEPR